jgi:hypothetical protein
VQPPASPPTYGWAQPQQQQMQNSPIAAPHYQNPGNGNGNGHQMQRPEEREEPSYDPATAWD